MKFPPPSMLQVNDVETEANYATTSTSVLRPYIRVNDQCETDFNFCIQLKPVNCDFYRQTDQDSAMCIPSQLYQTMDMCNEKSPSTLKYKICDGTFEWCNGGAPVMSELLKIDWISRGCAVQTIGKECDVRHRCFQRCLKEKQSGKCNFFAITSDNCRTFSTLDGTGFSSSSCGPWKVYQMSCVDGSCGDVKTIASTAASTVKTEYSTTVSGCVHFYTHIETVFSSTELLTLLVLHPAQLPTHSCLHCACSGLTVSVCFFHT